MAQAKILSLQQIKDKKFKFLEGISGKVTESFGQLTINFIMLIHGKSGNGKSNLIVQLMKELSHHGRCLYIALEEGHGLSIQLLVSRHLSDEYSGKIGIADHTMTYENLTKRLQRQRSEQFIFIDSIQYWQINYEMYKKLKESFPNKSFIFISHTEGKNPKGKTAQDIEYDATIKVRVDGYVGFMRSRLGGNKPYVIWEEGAKRYWGEKEFAKITGSTEKKKRTTKNETVKKDETNIVDQPQV